MDGWINIVTIQQSRLDVDEIRFLNQVHVAKLQGWRGGVEEVGEIETETGEVETEMGEVETETGEIETEMREVETEMGEVETEMGEIETEMGEIETEMEKVIRSLVMLQVLVCFVMSKLNN